MSSFEAKNRRRRQRREVQEAVQRNRLAASRRDANRAAIGRVARATLGQ